ncbi:MAG TPA: 3',5'-nucleoside bisphosphate phosphatase [Sulfuricella sp.]|nr:3',5'-nucleoside bisphosphate phosphatase [Sulfuricella sp.]
MSSSIDLHSHSTISDGLLTPSELVGRAAAQGVKVLALTDHDDVAGLEEARAAAQTAGISLVNGVEISVTWNNRSVHLVGLRIDPAYAPLRDGLAAIRAGRGERAKLIAAELGKAGIAGSLEGAYAYAANPSIISRTHFARFLVEKGVVKDTRAVFKKYLVKGKPGFVAHRWADFAEAIGWIRGSGGIAVLAHPGRYDLGRTNLGGLIADFKEAGGEAIEVVTGSHTADQFIQFAQYASEFGLLASCGSDFHGQGESYMDLGRLPELPSGCNPVWHDWPEMASPEFKALSPESKAGLTQHSALSTQH